MKIAAVCGSFHKEEIQKMLEYAIERQIQRIQKYLR